MTTGSRIESPFVGLVPYTEQDARFFFGREREQQIIIANLFASKLTVLYGASGVGKSSLLRAGVIRGLRSRIDHAALHPDEPALAVIYFDQWQSDALDRLKTVIGQAAEPGAPLPEGFDRLSLANVIRRVSGSRLDVMVIFDQFEEYFLYHPTTKDDPGTIACEFAEAANDGSLPVSFLISLRDDAVSRLDRFKHLIPNLFANYIRVGYLQRQDAREAVLGPIHAYNSLPDAQKVHSGEVAVEEALLEAILDDVRKDNVRIGESGRGRVQASASDLIETPYLQLVMTRLWSEELGSGSHVLRLGTFEKLGKAEAIVKAHLDDALSRLSDAEREVCARIFEFLVTPGGAKIAHTSSDLAGMAGVPSEQLAPTLRHLSGSTMRVLAPVASPQGHDGPMRYEIHHDSLAHAILEWRKRFVLERENERVSRERAVEAERMEKELRQARVLASAESARAEAEARGRRQLRAGLAVVGALLIASVGLLVYAWGQKQKADEILRQAVEASTQAQEASKQAVEASNRAIQSEQLAKDLAKSAGDWATQAADLAKDAANIKNDRLALQEFKERAAAAQENVEKLQREVDTLSNQQSSAPSGLTYLVDVFGIEANGVPRDDVWSFALRRNDSNRVLLSFEAGGRRKPPEPGEGIYVGRTLLGSRSKSVRLELVEGATVELAMSAAPGKTGNQGGTGTYLLVTSQFKGLLRAQIPISVRTPRQEGTLVVNLMIRRSAANAAR